jgi:hypothetical protein
MSYALIMQLSDCSAARGLQIKVNGEIERKIEV